jgi:Flp pilus assembly protein TadD
MTLQEARTHDFDKELMEIRLKEREKHLADNKNDQIALVGAGKLNFQLGNRAAAEDAFQRFFATDCHDALFINNAVFDYVEFGGTNLARAYELARKAQSLIPSDENIADTLAWVLFKRGFYQEALDTLAPLRRSPDVAFHLGMADYMLGQEEQARNELQKVSLGGKERADADRRLAVLKLRDEPSRTIRETAARARLAEAPEDPVALGLLAELYDSNGTDLKPSDPVVAKALGVRAFRRENYGRAVAFLSQSENALQSDAQLFLVLGMAQYHTGETNQCEDSLRKAVKLGLNAAQTDQANKILALLPTPTR